MLENSQLSSLFLSQSYKDTWKEFEKSLANPDYPIWDYVILTASNEHQAEIYNNQINDRIQNGCLHKHTHYVSIPDPEGKRVGSGGATLASIKYIHEREQSSDFSNLKILVIHSGGDSKRIPQYSALGKLFSPIPHKLYDDRSSTLFDELIAISTTIASRIKEGMFILSGDVLLLFNPLLFDYAGTNAVAISFKEDVSIGKNHGVFQANKDGYITRFLQKQSEQMLNNVGAVDDRGCVDIDTGAIFFSKEILSALLNLCMKNGKLSLSAYNKYVNENTNLSLYVDLLYPLGEDSTLEEYLKEPSDSNDNTVIVQARNNIWEALSSFKMKLLRIAPSKFIHLGTSNEVLKLMTSVSLYKNISWTKNTNSNLKAGVSGYNSTMASSVKIGRNCYIESSYIGENCSIGANTIISHLTVPDERTIPSNVVLHGLKLSNEKFVVRIFGINDNPKDLVEGAFLGSSLKRFIDYYGIPTLWDREDEQSIWNAMIYPVCQNIEDALDASLNLYNLFQRKGNYISWQNSEKISLKSGFDDADTKAIIDWNSHMHDLVRMENILKMIKSGKPANRITAPSRDGQLSKIQKEWLQKNINNLELPEKMRLYYYTGASLKNGIGNKYINNSFTILQESFKKSISNKLKARDDIHIIRNDYTVRMPLRVNFGGGWSDTPPYCIENGGKVLNAAILLNEKMPVQVRIKKINDLKIILDSRDLDLHGEFSNIEDLQNFSNPYDSFVLQKSALIACGIIPESGGNLKSRLKELGGGFEIHSEITNVPMGSGLGTSSILAAACTKAIMNFFGIAHTEKELCQKVLLIEQIMSTGGGWQDQIGGLFPGIKLITSKPGIEQSPEITQLALSPATYEEINRRFVLIYTGQRRLARNILRDVMGRYIGNNPKVKASLSNIQQIALDMSNELKSGNIDAFAKLMTKHWEESTIIDPNISNILIDQIFLSIEDMISGKMICGAGGGGFLQVILKNNVSKEDIRKRLKSVFMDSEIDVWEGEIDISPVR